MQKSLVYVIAVMAVVATALFLFTFENKKSITQTTDSSRELCTGPLAQCVGKKVTLIGAVSDLQFQSMSSPNGEFFKRKTLYVENYGPVAVFTKFPINVPDDTKIEVVGEVKAITGGGSGTKLGEVMTEYNILVDSWKKVE